MISIFWSGTVEDDVDFVSEFAKNWEYLGPEWAGCEANGADVVEDIAENFFQPEDWVELFGEEEERASILIKVHRPPSIAGRYRVDLERVTKARATKMDP